MIGIEKETGRKKKSIERLIRGKKGLCPWCLHDKARSTMMGTFCMKCGKDINIPPIKPKPMRAKGVYSKLNRRRKNGSE